MNQRKLSLKREVLTDLSDAQLRDLAGGTKTTTTVNPDTIYSCMTFVSCAIPFCMINRETLVPCIVN